MTEMPEIGLAGAGHFGAERGAEALAAGGPAAGDDVYVGAGDGAKDPDFVLAAILLLEDAELHVMRPRLRPAR